VGGTGPPRCVGLAGSGSSCAYRRTSAPSPGSRRDGVRRAVSDPFSTGHRADSHAQPDGVSDSHRYSHADPYEHAVLDPVSHAHAYAYRDTHADAASDPASQRDTNPHHILARNADTNTRCRDPSRLNHSDANAGRPHTSAYAEATTERD
jgi:hypothetical protein